jgi:hypothetical protein
VHFASLPSGGFINAIVVNSPERKLAKRTSVHCLTCYFGYFLGSIQTFLPPAANWRKLG